MRRLLGTRLPEGSSAQAPSPKAAQAAPRSALQTGSAERCRHESASLKVPAHRRLSIPPPACPRAGRLAATQMRTGRTPRSTPTPPARPAGAPPLSPMNSPARQQHRQPHHLRFATVGCATQQSSGSRAQTLIRLRPCSWLVRIKLGTNGVFPRRAVFC
jgi:hypothetical protein